MRPEQKYVMLEFGEFTYLRTKCFTILKERIENTGPDETCLVLEILCEKFQSEDSDSKSWKRVPTIPPEVLAKINRGDLEELIEVDYGDIAMNVHEKSLSTNWDNVLSGLITRKDDEEDNNVR